MKIDVLAEFTVYGVVWAVIGYGFGHLARLWLPGFPPMLLGAGAAGAYLIALWRGVSEYRRDEKTLSDPFYGGGNGKHG